jgi:hypothetical protein
MYSRKTGPGSEMNITLTMIWCQIVIQLVHMRSLGWYRVVFFLILTLTIVYKKISLYTGFHE